MNIIFLGTNDFSVSVLSDLIDSKHKVIAVVTQPDKPKGRGKKIAKPAVKVFAEKQGIPVYQFKKIRNQECVDKLKSLSPDIMVTASYGQILTIDVLNLSKYGVVNVHTSLLPKYRGPAPVQWAIVNGEQTTGITIMKTDPGIDTGDIILRESISIEENQNSDDVLNKMSKKAGPLLIEAIDKITDGTVRYIKQDEDKSSYHPMIKKNDARIDWSKSASEIINLVKGMYTWPVAYSVYDDKLLKIYEAIEILTEDIQTPIRKKYKPGDVVVANPKKGLIIKAKDNFVGIRSVQTQGSKRMDAKSFVNGKKIKENDILI